MTSSWFYVARGNTGDGTVLFCSDLVEADTASKAMRLAKDEAFYDTEARVYNVLIITFNKAD